MQLQQRLRAWHGIFYVLVLLLSLMSLMLMPWSLWLASSAFIVIVGVCVADVYRRFYAPYAVISAQWLYADRWRLSYRNGLACEVRLLLSSTRTASWMILWFADQAVGKKSVMIVRSCDVTAPLWSQLHLAVLSLTSM